MTSNKMVWKRLESKEIFKTRFFCFRTERLEMPDKRVMPHYYVFDFPDWVNVVAVTKDKKIVLIKQYRPPVEVVTLEIPGGSLHFHTQVKEDPMEAGRRELEEETGYVAGSMKLLGFHHPNPALQNNKLWTYLALDCEKKKPQNLDEFEDIEVLEVSIEEALLLSRNGGIGHSLVMVAFHLAQPFLEELIQNT